MASAILSAVLLVVCVQWSAVNAGGQEEQQKRLASSSCTLGGNIFQRVRREPDVIFSPLCAHISLSLAALGARGDSQKELLGVLDWAAPETAESLQDAYKSLLPQVESDDDGGEVSVAQSLYVGDDKADVESFKREAKDKYSALVVRGNPSSPQKAEDEINAYVSARTKNVITEALPRGTITAKTSVHVFCYLSVRSLWERKFDPCLTSRQPFYTLDGRTIEVDMMNDTRPIYHKQINNTDIVRIPFFGNRLSLVLAMPKERTGLSQLEDAVNDPESRREMLDIVDKKKMELGIPKVNLTSSIYLEQFARELGLIKTTSTDQADFSGISISKDRRLYLSNIQHTATMILNEKGIFAAASQSTKATGIISSRTTEENAAPLAGQVIFNKPFIFFIVNNRLNNHVMFMGKKSNL